MGIKRVFITLVLLFSISLTLADEIKGRFVSVVIDRLENGKLYSQYKYYIQTFDGIFINAKFSENINLLPKINKSYIFYGDLENNYFLIKSFRSLKSNYNSFVAPYTNNKTGTQKILVAMFNYSDYKKDPNFNLDDAKNI